MSEEQKASVAAEEAAMEAGTFPDGIVKEEIQPLTEEQKQTEVNSLREIAESYKDKEKPLKICIISSAAIATPPQESEYAGLEVMTGNLAVELARRGHSVYLFSTKGSRLAGHWGFEEEGTGKEGGGTLDVFETIEPTMTDATAEFNHFLAYNPFILEHFGKGEGSY